MVPSPPRPDQDPTGESRRGGRGQGERRRRGLLNHLIAYLAVLVVVVPVNYLTAPDRPWFLLLMVGWGAPLAVHTAWAMGLFGDRKGRSRPADD